MRLNTIEWGDGARVAVLVHGMMSSAGLWNRFGPDLATRGYRVIAVDLRGHGGSGHADSYRPEDFASDLVDTVPDRPDIVIGHSLGGLALSLAVDRLRPDRAVYVDPAFSDLRLSRYRRTMLPIYLRSVLRRSASDLARRDPHWSADDIAEQVAAFRAVDRAALRPILMTPGAMRPPRELVVPSLIVLADGTHVLDTAETERLRALGFVIRVVPGAGHNVHLDDYDGFLTALDGWI